MALVDIANNAGGKIGGFGDQNDGSGQVTAAQLTADADRVSEWINDKYPVVRKKVIAEFAALKTPFEETQKFADLGDDLKQDDVGISTIVSVAGVVTFTTDKAHELSVADTRFFADIQGTLVTSLNGNTYAVATVPSTTTFTLTGVTGTASWDHTDGTGIISKAPEMGAYQYAFTLPSDFYVLVRQTDEVYTVLEGVQQEYQCKKILNRDGDGLILLTNDLTNEGGDSAYIEYCIDQETFTLFSPAFEECIAMLLAVELCPILGRDLETRQKLLVEYKKITIPDAKRFNQSQLNNHSRIIPDYSGGRSGRGSISVRGGTLGTYKDAQGNRQSI